MVMLMVMVIVIVTACSAFVGVYGLGGQDGYLRAPATKDGGGTFFVHRRCR